MYWPEHYVRATRKSSCQKRNGYFHSDEILVSCNHFIDADIANGKTN